MASNEIVINFLFLCIIICVIICLMANTYLVGEFSKLVGKTVSTLQRWDRDGTLIAFRTPSGRRFYTHDQYLAVKGQQSSEKGEIIGYCRISDILFTKSLGYQKDIITKYCNNERISVDRWLEDVGSAISFDRLNFIKMMEYIEIGSVSKVIVAHEDRLIRIGFEWFERFCSQHGTEIIVLSKKGSVDIELISPLEEMDQDLEVILLSFERLKKKKKNVLKS
jgi:putative resolvase